MAEISKTFKRKFKDSAFAPASDHGIESSSLQCMDEDGGIDDDENKAAPAPADAGAPARASRPTSGSGGPT
jgi:hypothetical protein